MRRNDRRRSSSGEERRTTGADVVVAGGDAMAITVGDVAVGEGLTASDSKGTDLARLDIRGWALNATDPDLRIEIRRLSYTDKMSLPFRF